MSASYPNLKKTFTTKVDEVDTVDAAHVNELQLEVRAIQDELGLNPSGGSDTVGAFLASLNSIKYQEGNVIKASGGTAGAPGYAFDSEATLGVFRVGAGILGLSAGGVERLRASASGVSVTDLGVTGTLTVTGSTTGIDHGALGGRTDDDHTAYPLVTGARGFTGAVPGVDPTASTHLTTKQYVDARVPSGSIIFTARNTAPSGWLLCDGAAVSRTTYADLFAAISTTYGSGDGSTTFNLPDIRDRFPVGAGSAYARNDKGGATTVALSSAEMPAHVHSGPSHSHTVDPPSTGTSGVGDHTHGSGSYGINNAYDLVFDADATGIAERMRQAGRDQDYAVTGTSGSGGSHSHSVNIGAFSSAAGGTNNTGSTGSGSAHENRPPYIALFAMIRT